MVTGSVVIGRFDLKLSAIGVCPDVGSVRADGFETRYGEARDGVSLARISGAPARSVPRRRGELVRGRLGEQVPQLVQVDAERGDLRLERGDSVRKPIVRS